MPSIVYLAADHAGFELKEELREYVRELGYPVEDLGAHEFNAADDYPDFVIPCAQKVAADNGARGILVGASGQGEAMCANRLKNVRAAVFYGKASHMQTDTEGISLDMIAAVRMHNDANILSLGARFLSSEEAKEVVRQFLETPFPAAARHARRIAKY